MSSICARGGGPLWAWMPGRSTELPVLSSSGSRPKFMPCALLCTRHIEQPHGHPASHQEPQEGGGPTPEGTGNKGSPARGPTCNHIRVHPCSTLGDIVLPSFNKHAFLWAQPALGTGDMSALSRSQLRGHEPTGQQGVHMVSAQTGRGADGGHPAGDKEPSSVPPHSDPESCAVTWPPPWKGQTAAQPPRWDRQALH